MALILDSPFHPWHLWHTWHLLPSKSEQTQSLDTYQSLYHRQSSLSYEHEKDLAIILKSVNKSSTYFLYLIYYQTESATAYNSN